MSHSNFWKQATTPWPVFFGPAKFTFVTNVLLLVVPFFAAIACAQAPPLVPLPSEIEVAKEQFCQLPETVSVAVPDLPEWRKHIESLPVIHTADSSHQFELSSKGAVLVEVSQSDQLEGEAYTVEVEQDRIAIQAGTLKGLTRATATLAQIVGSARESKIKQLSIKDTASVSYRSLMIDMGRNPHSYDLIRESIDFLWFYKIDSLHLHLTDDQRFAFPSTAFPKLWDGLITLDQFRELEQYARRRGVTLIPELEVPGHSTKLIQNYPEVFGGSATELAREDHAFEGIKTILDEMMDVFSSPIIHIGGDEAFGVPEELQRDLINRLHAYLKSKGRQTVVWEGPGPGRGENRVNKEVIHINWRTINYPANRMLEDGYRVVNAAWDPLYVVDHYPRINFTMTSPRHIYETLKLRRFKHVNPGITTFAKPTNVDDSNRLIGFCMPWWEGREANYFDQVFPRLIPFAEVAWRQPEQRDYAEFERRAKSVEQLRRRTFYPLEIETDMLAIEQDGVFHDSVTVSIAATARKQNSDQAASEIRYTLDGSPVNGKSNLYRAPFTISKTSNIRAAAFSDSKPLPGYESRRKLTRVSPVANLALGKPVTSSVSSGPPFSVERITDGGTGKLDFYLGYPAQPEPIEITIDLEKVQTVQSVTVFAYTISGSWEKYSVEVSQDGKKFERVAARMEKPDTESASVEHQFEPRKARYVRISSHGNRGYVFDSFSKIIEVQVR